MNNGSDYSYTLTIDGNLINETITCYVTEQLSRSSLVGIENLVTLKVVNIALAIYK